MNVKLKSVPVLKTRVELARFLGVSRTTLYQMEAEGCPFPAGKCHPDWALDWLKNHPHFRPFRAGKKKETPKAQLDPVVSISGKRH
jgi:DNA-binding XRE family transcriptional regulator